MPGSTEIRKNILQHAFASGEMSPSTLARLDLKKYAAGVQGLINFQLAPQGGIYNDTGTVYVGAAKFGNTKCRLFPFVFSNLQTYQIEMGEYYARFYTNGGQILSGGSPVEVVTPYLDTDLASIQYVQSGDYLYLTHPNYPPAAITRTSNTIWSYIVLTFQDGPYQDLNINNAYTLTASRVTGSITLTANFNAFFSGNVGGLVRLEEAISTYYQGWAANECFQGGDIVSNAGKVYQCAGNLSSMYPTYNGTTAYNSGNVVTNAGNIYCATGSVTGGTAPVHLSGVVNSWQFISVITTIKGFALGQWQNGVAYPIGYYVFWGVNVYVSSGSGTSGTTPPVHTTDTSYVSDGGVGWIYLGKKSGTQPPIHAFGTQSDGNLSWTYLHSGFGYAKITGYTSPTQVSATVISQLPNSSTGGTINFRLPVWDTYNGYPSVVCFYEQRLCFAANANFPQTIWMSNTEDYYNFAPTTTGSDVLDTNSLNLTLASQTVNQIVWMNPHTRLLVGTIGGEWQIWPESTQSGFSPSNVQAKQMSSYGSALLPARLVNLATLYVHRSQQKIYEMTYQYLYDLYVSKDQNLIADHILRNGGGVVDTAYQLAPYSTLWYLRTDGVLVGMTYLAEEEVTGWHEHQYAGFIESISVIPNPITNLDQLWIVTKRTINGSTVRYIEYLQDPFNPLNPQDKSKMWYVECGLSLTTSTPVTTVSGLGYLQGQTVVPVVDGAVQPTQVVPGSGTITLQFPANSQVVVGLPMTATVTTMPLDMEGELGNLTGLVKRVHAVTLVLLNSLGFTAFAGTVSQPTGPAGPVQTFRPTTGLMNESPDLFTGSFGTGIAMGQSTDGVITIQQTQPYPLNILGIVTRGKGYET